MSAPTPASKSQMRAHQTVCGLRGEDGRPCVRPVVAMLQTSAICEPHARLLMGDARYERWAARAFPFPLPVDFETGERE